jgi:hypothetical protein
MQNFLHILEEQTPKKNKKNLLPKNKFERAAEFKMATNINLLVKTTNHFYFKKAFQGCFSCLIEPEFFLLHKQI